MAYNSKNMLKSKEFWIGFLVAVIVFVGLTELQKSNNRATAMTNLNSGYSHLKTDREKVAAIFTANTKVADNKSWFNFSNSHADEGNPDQPMLFDDSGEVMGRGASLQEGVVTVQENSYVQQTTNVTDMTVWMNPTTGNWEQLGCKGDGC